MLASLSSVLLSHSAAHLTGTIFSIRLEWVPYHSFILGKYATDELTRRCALLQPSTVLCSSLHLRIHSFSQTASLLSHLNFLTHRSPQHVLRNLCFIFTLVSLSSLQLTQFWFKLLSSELVELRILIQRLRPFDPKHF